MVDDFTWSADPLRKLRVGVRSLKPIRRENVKLQPFEVVVAAVFAQLRPDYEWWVTPNRPDGGVDFVGRGVFLNSKELGIDAAITIGGQCKKRNNVKDVVAELSGSFTRMAHAINPTLFVAAFSARLTPNRVMKARQLLEETHRRHCHILDRVQVESLIGANLGAAEPVIRKAFEGPDAEFILDYFRGKAANIPTLDVKVVGPSSALGGETFRVSLQITRSSISDDHFRLHWNAPTAAEGALVTPIAAALAGGLTVDFRETRANDPFALQQNFEFLLYSIGEQPLGSFSIYTAFSREQPVSVVDLPAIRVVENLRPRFYEEPYRVALDEIERAFVKAGTGRIACVAVAGAGGAGKSRLCEEAAMEARRQGARVVSARQAHTVEFPRRIFANLLLGLTGENEAIRDPAGRVHNVLRTLEPGLAVRAVPVIETLFDQAGIPGSADDDQALLSVLAVLIVERSRLQPLVIHLHDLHWCTHDVLETLDRLIWQLDQLKASFASGAAQTQLCVLFLLEGRMHEYRATGETGWSTRVYERFIERLECPTALCRAFLPAESATFAARLFEQLHSAHRLLPESLMELQQDLITCVHQAAGGNPFHMLEHVKLLQQHGILGQNPRTGFMYMKTPGFEHVHLPRTVFEAVEARWRYYWEHQRALALLLWSVALVDDNLPSPLFRHLWSWLAPATTQVEIESTEFINLPRHDDEGFQVSFRHENYFQAVRQLQLPSEDRRAVIEAYTAWFEATPRLSPALRHAQARVALEAPNPDRRRVRQLLQSAHKAASKRGDRGLAARILATLLDGVMWALHREMPLPANALAQACDDEIQLCDHLIHSGRPDVARERIDRVLSVIAAFGRERGAAAARDAIMRHRFVLLAMKAGILFHDRQAGEAVVVTEQAVREVEQLITRLPAARRRSWNSVVMDVLDAHSAAIALSGDLRRAVVEARKAAAIAESLINEHPNALEVIITSSNILLCDAPEESESVLSRYARLAERRTFPDGTRLRLNLNLGMSRIVLADRARVSGADTAKGLLESAHRSLLAVFQEAHPLGRLADAAAASLLLGLISALRQQSDDIDWFSQSVAVAIRARQMETLWRAHINLAHSLHRQGQNAHDSAAAALELMDYSLSRDPEADRSPRFNLVALPMAHAVRYLLLTQDDKASAALRKYPALGRMFQDVEAGELKADRDGRTSHEWLRIGDVDYVIF
jgi:hypothetical protein